ncbi:hypothetical protein [Ralstonia phage RP13]|nr:hypothetical protein [Ralstonia phage RP13]
MNKAQSFISKVQSINEAASFDIMDAILATTPSLERVRDGLLVSYKHKDGTFTLVNQPGSTLVNALFEPVSGENQVFRTTKDLRDFIADLGVTA